jgi:uncharacterized protein (DUF2252 family)
MTEQPSETPKPAPNGAARRAVAKRTPAKKATAKKATATKAATKAATQRAPARKVTPKASPRIAAPARTHPYRTLEERVARGLAWREAAPLEGHAQYRPNRRRSSPIGILRGQDDARVQELIPIRYGRMSASAFAFYRGSAAIMAYDLSSQAWTPGRTQICGDAHLSNFGVFGSPERDLVFDLNDFDETLPGPFEWDVKRLVASFVLAARDRGFKRKEARLAVRAALLGYRTAIADLAQMTTLDVWYTRIDEQMILDAVTEMGKQQQPPKGAEQRLLGSFEAARRKTSMRAAQKLTEVVDGHHRFREDPPLLSRGAITDEYRRRVSLAFAEYRSTLQSDRRRLIERYHMVDVAMKVVGVGSVGTRAGILLLQGRDADDPLIMQFKEATTSVLEPYLGASRTSQHGERVVDGQRYMQAVSDIFLGWVRGAGGRDFYVRQLHDMKGSVDVTRIQPFGLTAYARMCGATLARAHARGGDVVAIDSYIGADESFAEAIEEFAQVYADQAEQDYGRLQQAISSGEIEVRTGI